MDEQRAPEGPTIGRELPTRRPRRHSVVAVAAVAAVAILALGGCLTAEDIASHGALVIRRSGTPDATDTGEVQALKRAAAGEPVLAADLADVAAFIRGENDGTDFRLITLLRLLLAHPDRLDAGAVAMLRDLLKGVRYWMDEPGMNAMVYWSENHQVLFAASEYLAGQWLPDERFRDGRTGAEHRDDAAARLDFWIEQRWTYGFSEWNSHYYAQDIAALSALFDLADDRGLKARAAMILDLLLLDLAARSFHGEFIPTSGRLYDANRIGGDEIIRRIMRHAFDGTDELAASDAIDIGFLLSGYRTPPVLASIAQDDGPTVVTQRFGRDPAEVAGDPAFTSDEQRIMALWGMQAFTEPEAIEPSFDWIRVHGLLENPYLAPFRQLDFRVLRLAGALPLVSRLLDLPANGTTLGRADTLTYRSPDLQMSTTQAYRPGSPGNQQAIFQLVLGAGISLFHTHPGAPSGEPGPNGATPTYWAGSGILPTSCQDRAISVSLYELPDRPGFGLAQHLAFTHLHLPTGSAVRIVRDERQLFLQVGRALVGVTAASTLRVGATDEIIQDGRRTAWAVEASSASVESFDAFAERLRGATLSLDGSTAAYRSGTFTLSAGRATGCWLNGEPLPPITGRLPSPYASSMNDRRRYRVEHGGHGLELDLAMGTRRAW